MVYEWEDKVEICHRLYVEEKKPLDEVMEYMKTNYGFTPSKRAFQTQFKRWNFPSKQNPAHKNVALVARVQQLWERNASQKDMLRVLHEEGFDINERELMRLRGKNRWLLRVPNGMKNPPGSAIATDQPITPAVTDDAIQQLEQALNPENASTGTPHTPTFFPAPDQASPELSPEVLRKRQERLAKLQADSDERWLTRKRRRRTRGWAGLPADPEGPPRFPSETTIDESKAYLQLDNELYRDLRDQFQGICEAEGVIKKTKAGPEKWQSVKDMLVSGNQHLQHVIYNDQTVKQDQKLLSLDVICTDVTKRMRTLERRMTIAEAKNALGINPEESRQIRNSFYALLKADHFTSKLEAGDQHWNELKEKWIQESPLLTNILAPGAVDPQHQTKVKAVEVLCRDVMKRLRDDQTKKDPSRKKPSAAGPGPGPAPPRHNQAATAGPSRSAPTATMVSGYGSDPRAPQNDDFQIDPSLLLAAANDSSMALDAGTDQMDYQSTGYANTDFAPRPAPIQVDIQLNQHSHVQSEPKQWAGFLAAGTVAELRTLATSAHNATVATRIDGIESSTGQVVSYPIDDDRDLERYLSTVSGGKPTFVVRLAAA